MVIKNGQSAARKRQPKSAPSSSVKTRSNSVSKDSSHSNNSKAADKLDGNIICLESTALESEAGDRILETAGITEAVRGGDLPSESTELTAITLHQPWASLITAGYKQYETRDWPTSYRGSIAIHAGRKPKGKQELREHDKVVTSFDDLLTEDCPYSSVIAIAQLTDVILMTEEFISQQSQTELRCGNWQVGRYAFKLENVRAIAPISAKGSQGLWKWNQESAGFNSLEIYPLEPWNPADFGEVQHKAEENGQLNLLEWEGSEPPDPDDYVGSIEQFEAAYKAWVNAQTDEAEEELANFGEQELCDILMDGSTFAAELGQASPMPESNCGSDRPITSVNGTATAEASLLSGIPASTELPISESVTSVSAAESSSLVHLHHANPSALTENGSQPKTAETASQMYSELSEQHNQNSQLSKTSEGCSVAPTLPEINQEATSDLSSTPYRQAGTMRNGFVSGATSLPLRGVGREFLLLRSPGALSGSTGVRPPGKTRLENQLQELSLISSQEVVAPEFLEAGYNLPIGFTNPKENRTALELAQAQAQQLPIAPKSELLAEMATIETEEKPSEMPLIGELQRLDSGESSTLPNLSPELIESWTDWEKSNFLWLFEFDFCMHKGELKKIEKFLPGTKTIRLEGMKIGSTYLQMWEVEPPRFADKNTLIELPPNIGALSKTELISMATEQHQLICVIERKEFELAIEKLHRYRLAGLYLQEFKKRCQYGEWENQLEQSGISVRSAQNYIMISKNWETVEAKAKLVSLLPEESQPTIGLKWALEAVRDEKKQLKSAAPPKDPDSWRTPNTKDQPVVNLVKKALGGEIWLDPCSGSVTSNIPCAVRYFKADNGLAQHQGWSKTVFINPPFSDPSPWVQRCCLEFARGNVSAAVMLLKAGVVANVGTGELINKYASAICHWRGRINFLNDEGNPVKGSDFDCVLIYFGTRLDLFREAFGGRGTIATIENHYSSVNKKYMIPNEKPEFGNVEQEQKQLAAAVGLGNGRSGVLPDMRDRDRELSEKYDPHTVVDVLSVPPSMPTPTPAPAPISKNLVEPLGEVESFDETPLAVRQFETAKQNCLNDYITAISSNISDFSDEQLKFLIATAKKELNNRNHPEYFRQRPRKRQG